MKFNTQTFIPYKDQFNYYNLIQKINPSYRLFFDRKKRLYKIVNIHKNNEICMSFSTFYRNILFNLRFSKIENCNKILSYIDSENDKIYNQNMNKLHQNISSVLNDFHQLNSRSKTINTHDINKIIGAAKC